MDEKDKPVQPDPEKDLPEAEERWRRFTWMPGDLVFLGNVNDEPAPKPEPKSKPEK